MNRILNRQDYYDVEGSACVIESKAEIWKLQVSHTAGDGSLALGISVNGALGRDNRAKALTQDGYRWSILAHREQCYLVEILLGVTP
jgi:hypothetical protein